MNHPIYMPRGYIFTNTIFKMSPEVFFSSLAFIIFSIWIIKGLKKEKIKFNTKDISIFLFVAIFGSLTGGRIWYYLENWQGWITLAKIFDLRYPGLTSFGMIIGGIVSILVYIYFFNKKNKIEKNWTIAFAKIMDIVAPASALFIFIYRMGCFFYGDVPGTMTNLPWGVFAVNYGNNSGNIIHPTALYLSFSGLLIFILIQIIIKKKHYEGYIGLIFIILYSINRFIIEFFIQSNNYLLEMSTTQLILLMFIILSGLLLIKNHLLLLKLKN